MRLSRQAVSFSAADLYLKILENDSTDKSVLYNLAESFYLAKDYEEAAIYFYKSYKSDSANNATSLYYAALCTKMQGKYTQARDMFKRFSKNYQGADALKMKKWARVESDGCSFALKETAGDQNLKLVHLGKEVNSNYADQAPAYRNDVLYFASIHSDTVLWMNKDMSDSKKDGMLMKLYTSKVSGESYEPAERVKTFDQTGKHISNGSFSNDGTKFFYTICDGGLLKPNCDIYMSQLDGTDWDPGKKLNDEINLKGVTNTQPFLAKESGGNEVLYFVSDREGGKGGLDIWYAPLSKKGEFGAPKNAGNKINTDRDEVTPFWDTKTNTLYFSSNGWINMGGYDIFKSQSEGAGKYSTAENLGAPFNSPCNDYYYRFGKSNADGYLVSNRPGIFSVRGKTCCDDIFEYKYVHKIDLAVKGRVFDETTRQPIPAAVVSLSLQSKDNTGGDVVLNTDSLQDTGPYLFNLNPEKLYKVTGTKDGYFTASQTFNTKGAVKSDTMVVDIYLKKLEKNKAYRLNNIYYDFDKADLRPASKATLDTLYNILTENPLIIIELSSHTDSRGNDQYNLELSQKRAESCVNYLINEKGIAKERVTAKGYGKTKPLEDCSKYPDCPNDQSGDCPCHQLKQAYEFKIIGELEGKVILDNE